LEVFSWWTSGSEAAALKVLEDAFTAAAPGATFKNAAVSGGGGSNARTVLSTRLQGGNPPDSWQLHPDQDLFAVVEDGSAADITDLYQANGWEAKLPDTVKNMLQKDGKYYAVPVNAHRANVLWTNPDVLKKAGVSLSETTSIMANVGADELVTGKLPFDDPKVRTAVEQFKTVLQNTNNDAAVLTWDQAALNTANGKCATNLMGDWAYGELNNKGKKDGTDFSHVTFPGTSDIFDFVGDAFVIPAENAPNPQAEKVWLTQLMDPKVQSEFNLKKGSAPVVKDASLEGYPDYQKKAAEAFQTKTIVSSLAHAQSAPAEFATTYSDGVTSFLGWKNVDAFLKTMTEAQKNQLG
jgi:glucose/mannose transport system substrate-binding protein